jgi:hypothetical protein
VPSALLSSRLVIGVRDRRRCYSRVPHGAMYPAWRSMLDFTHPPSIPFLTLPRCFAPFHPHASFTSPHTDFTQFHIHFILHSIKRCLIVSTSPQLTHHPKQTLSAAHAMSAATAIAAAVVRAAKECCDGTSKKQQPLAGHERCAGGFDVLPGHVHPWHQPAMPSQESFKNTPTRPVIVTANPMVKSQVRVGTSSRNWRETLAVHTSSPLKFCSRQIC